MKTIEEIEKYLQFHKKKYYVKSFFRKAKSLIVDFIPLEKIPKFYKFYNKTLRNSIKGEVFLPTSIIEKGISVSVTLPAIEIFGLQDVYFCTDSTAFLSKDCKEIYFEQTKTFSKDYNILYNTSTMHFHSHHLVKLTNYPKIERKEEALFLAGTFTFNYFHFLIEMMSKIQFLNKIPNFENLIIAVDAVVEKNENLKTILSFFIKSNEIEYLPENTFYNFKKTWHITAPNSTVPNIAEGEKYQADFTLISKESVEYVRNICLQNFDIQQVKVKAISKMFLARKSKFRKYNEDEILNIATKFGFEPVYFEDCNIHEQIFYVQNADYIVGPSGAAWTNIIFCEENKTKGLMWLGKVWGDFSVFSTLAKLVNFNLFNYRFQQEGATFHSNYELPIAEFEEQLEKLLLK